jgi:phytoene desaturase
MKHAIVIGAGIGGLASACLLANKGFRVSVFEKNSFEGGKMKQIISGGYRFDAGPSLLTMPFQLEKLFNRCGADLSDSFQYEELKPLCRYFYPDGVVFDNFTDRDKTAEQINTFAPQDINSYYRFLDRSEQIYNYTAKSFLFNPLYSLTDLVDLKFRHFLDIDAFSTVSEKVDEQISTNYLRQFFKRFTTYNGSSPYKAPATLNVIPHVELNQGGYYVKGGLFKVAENMRLLAEKKGVIFHFNSPIESILTSGKKAVGVRLEDGSEHSCDLLFANTDVSETVLNLLPKYVTSRRKRRNNYKLNPLAPDLCFFWAAKNSGLNSDITTFFFPNGTGKSLGKFLMRKFCLKIRPSTSPTPPILNRIMLRPAHLIFLFWSMLPIWMNHKTGAE